MASMLFGVVLDILVLGCLSAVIYYTIRLSKNLDNFKSNRAEMKALIADLTKNIDRAQAAIDGLKVSGDNAGRGLQDLINESRMMSDELQIINEAGNSLAGRLENLAGQARPPAQKNIKSSLSLSNVLEMPQEADEEVNSASSMGSALAFSIQDRDFEGSAGPPSEENEQDWGDDTQEMDVPDDLQSQAEKELFRALQKNKKQKASSQRR